MSRAALKNMSARDFGSIVFISSDAAVRCANIEPAPPDGAGQRLWRYNKQMKG
jgi:hypothetical protein